MSIRKKNLRFLLSSIVLTLLVLLGCSEFEIENPFYEKDGVWIDPFNLTAVNNTDDSSQVQLSWTRPGDLEVESYRLYRSKSDSSSFDQDNPVTVGRDAVTYMDTAGLNSGVPYFYKISAIVGGVESRCSDITAAVTPKSVEGSIDVKNAGKILSLTDVIAFTSLDSSKETIILENKGNKNVKVSSISASNDWVNIGLDDFPSDSLVRADGNAQFTVEIDWEKIDKANVVKSSEITIVTSEGDKVIKLTAEKIERAEVKAIFESKIQGSEDTIQFYYSDYQDAELTIINKGNVTVSLTEAASPAWMKIEGFTSDESLKPDSLTNFTAKVVWDSLAKDEIITGTITVTSDKGPLTIPVKALKLENMGRITVKGGSVVDFGTSVDSKDIILSNTGNAEIEVCSVSTKTDWIVSDSGFPLVYKSIGVDKSVTLSLGIDTSKMVNGPDTGYVKIDFGNGNVDLMVTAFKPYKPEISLTPSEDTLDFDVSENEITVTVKNTGDGILELLLPTFSNDEWVELNENWDALDTVKLKADSVKNVKIRVNRDNIPKEGTYTTSVTFKAANADPVTVGIKVKKVDLNKPHLTVSILNDTVKDTVAFIPGRQEAQIKLENTGGGTLVLVRPTHGITQGTSWLTIDKDGTWGGNDTIYLPQDSTKIISLNADTSGMEQNQLHSTFISFNAVNAESDSLIATLLVTSHVADTVFLESDSSETHNSASISWSSSKSAYFSQYRIYRDTNNTVSNNEDFFVDSIDDNDSVTFTDTGLESMKDYYYRVYVVTDGGIEKGAPSNVVKVTTKPAVVVQGTVKNRNGGASVSNAKVILSVGSFADTVSTDTSGTYLFANPNSGDGTLSVSKVTEGGVHYLDNSASVTVPSGVGVVAQDMEMTAVSLQSKSATTIGSDPILDMTVANGQLFAYSLNDGLTQSLQVQTIITNNDVFERDVFDTLFSGRDFPFAFNLKESGSSVLVVSAYDSVGVGREGAIARLSSTMQKTVHEVTGIPYGIYEGDTYTYVLSKRGSDGNGWLKRYNSSDTDFSSNTTANAVLDLSSGNNAVQLDQSSGIGTDLIYPLMRVSENTMFITTGMGASKRIVKIALSGSGMSVDKVLSYPTYGKVVTDIEIVGEHIYVVDNTNKLFIYDFDFNLKSDAIDFGSEAALTDILPLDSAFGDYILIRPQENIDNEDLFFVSTTSHTVAGKLKATNMPTSAVVYDAGKVALATAQGASFTNFNIIETVE